MDMDKEGHKSIELNKAYEELEDLEEGMDLDLDDDDEEDQDHLKFEFEKQEDDEQDDDDDDDYDDDDDEDDDDEVDEKVARLLPKETMIDVYSDETVDAVEVRSNKRKKDEEEVIDSELDDDDNDYDFEQVEEMTFPSVVKKIENGKTVYEMEVAVIKDDDCIDDSLYRDDFEPTDTKKDFAEALYFRPPKIQAKAPDVCPICFKHWTSHYKHRVCCLPCGHIFGASCIKKWLQTDLRSTRKKCPQCNVYCTLEDVIPLNATSFRIPTADKGADDQKTSTRSFPLCSRGLIAFHKFEIARRNFALKKWFDAKKRLARVLRRENEAMKRRTDLLDRMKALEQQGISLYHADALGTLADEFLRQAKACEGKAEALRQRAKAYNQRFNAFEQRLLYFVRCVEDVYKLR